MRRVKYLVAVVIATAILALGVAPSYAQSSELVTAQVDRNNVTTDESLVLTVSVDSAAGDPAQPALPPLDGFSVLGSSRGTQMSLINGNLSMQTTYQYRLQPTQTGDLVIGPIAVTVNGNTFQTAPIAVHISQGTGVPQPANPGSSLFSSLPNFPNLPNLPSFPGFPSLPTQPTAPSAATVPVDPAPVPNQLAGQDFYVEAVVNNAFPYQGQQVTYTLRFYQAVNTGGQTEYQPPTFTGFWSEQVPEQGEYTIQAAGRNYRVTELKTILFPTVIGEVAIEPATLTVPGDFFSRGATMRTQPTALNVQPLPDNAPASFQGAVGRYSIEAAVDSAQTKVNDTITLRVAIGGEGNIENLSDPKWPDGPEWRAFDSEAKVESRIENGKVMGSRTYDRVLVPTVAGNLTLPSIEYSYFDPESGQYVTASSEPIAVVVAPDGSAGTNGPAGPTTSTSAATLPTAANGAARVTIESDIRSIKEAPAKWQLSRELLTQQPAFWLLWAVPVFLLVGQFGWQRWQNSRHYNAATRRSQQAAKKARQALRQARRSQERAYDAAGQILNSYLSEKLNHPVSGMTQSSLATLLQSRGISPRLIERVQNCLALSEMGRYAPSNDPLSGGDILTETEQVIGDLDKSL